MPLLDSLTRRDGADGAAMIARVLRSVREHMGMEVAYVSEFVGDRSVFREVDAPGLEALIKPGDARPLAEVYCPHILAGRLPELIPDTAAEPLAAAMAITHATPIGAHVSVPLKLADGSIYGMFCCLSPQADRSLNTRDLGIMRAFAELVAGEIDKGRDAGADTERRRAAVADLIDRQRLSILLQPIFDFTHAAPTGFECLARFDAEPRRPPNEWFAEAAAVGLGVDLELAAIRTALKASSALPDPVYLSVNASAEALMSEGFAEAVSPIAPHRLVIELTEHAEVLEYAGLAARLARFRADGAKLAIDDAGAGYAGLQHLVQLKPDLIKLDMALTRNIDSDAARRALAAALIFYARETGSAIIAEGIETQAELQTLRVLGIQRGQGYLLGRPASLADATASVGAKRAA
jgi:EAL domain-containing protein (putative c-di-GMP-specific phosphodiesterase class I)